MKSIQFMLCILLMAFSPALSYSQTHSISADSLKFLLSNEKNDTVRINLCNKISEKLWRNGAYKEAVFYAEEALKTAEGVKSGFTKGKALAQRNMGMTFFYMGNYAAALERLFSCLKLYETSADKNGIAVASESIGIVYRNQGHLNEALKFHEEALRIRIDLKSEGGMASSYNNIGIIYYNLGNLQRALENYTASLRIKEKKGHRQGIGSSFHNISGVYSAKADSALQKGNKAAWENYLNKAMDYCMRSLEIDEELNNRQGAALVMNSIGIIFLKKNQLADAENYFRRSYKLADKIGSVNDAKDAEQNLSEVLSRKGNYKEAFIHFKNYIRLRDSVHSDESAKKAVQSQMQYDFDKKSSADSIKNAETKKIDQINHQSQIRSQKLYTYAGLGGFLVMIVVAGISFVAFRNKKKANIEIALQKDLVEIKQKEILDSIYYARRIQRALLTSEKYISRKIKELKP